MSRLEQAPAARQKSDQVSELLKKAREDAGLTLRDVAESLNIRYVYVEALEAGNYDKLPGKTYAVGFLRTYAQYIGLDVGEILRRFKEEEAGPDPDTQLVFPTPVPEGKVPGGALIVVSVVFVAMAYGAWSFLSEDEMAVADLVPPVPKHLQTLFDGEGRGAEDEPTAGTRNVASVPNMTSPVFALPQPGEEQENVVAKPVETATAMPAPETATPALAPVVENAVDSATVGGADLPSSVVPDTPLQAPLATEPSVAEQVLVAPARETESQSATARAASESIPKPPAAAVRSEAREQIAAVPAASDLSAIPAAPSTDGDTAVFEDLTPRIYGEENTDARVILHATQDSWVQVRDGEDSLRLTRLLRAGDSYRVPNRPDLKMLTGNAGGLEIEVDGRSLGPLGPVGKVRRDLPLDPESLSKRFNLAQ